MRNTDDYIIFYHLIEQGSFSAAARHMSLTKSVVSKRIAKLEQELGVQLLYRTTRTLTLTEAGRAFFTHAKAVYQAVATAEESIVGLGKNLSGNIKVSVPTISGELILPQVINEFNQKYPDINIDMDLDNRFVDIVNERFDLAIRTGVLPDSSLIARKLVDANWIVCASPQYLAKHGIPKQPQALDKHNCLVYSYQETGAREWAFKDGDEVYQITVDGNLCTNNSSVLRNVALLGQGIIYVPRVLVYEDLKQGRLIQLFKDETAKCLGIYAVYPYTRQQPEKIKIFIDHLYTSFQSQNHRF
ncbi:MULTISPECIES: LysR family transcriptional regulator [Vibrio]|jgi:DNA-binding transcriptional LysR family regulator|uniref:LysR family transcriptional regulator n=3 Tax=Vibrio diabolicus TaxID=50719 RepID=A0AAX1XPS6_9VIBR|nr:MULTISPECIES: LysR family transcriptional regulator [Vibrio]MCR9610340.1 LysR family transcriptional regulator [Vibrio alginolyticus]AVF93636.1 LysR family transcriptional regulator [Vibrio diabolicus]AVH30061.1 LysR family transcriptional regulator [Vibrio diabolicus]KAB0319577.1 LysR family transcriptional regulator [Vibrio diabolicus]MCG9230342.1 LysR family transcriptional regulator [Vibrio diabolicus]